jgi:hypothetical protein
MESSVWTLHANCQPMLPHPHRHRHHRIRQTRGAIGDNGPNLDRAAGFCRPFFSSATSGMPVLSRRASKQTKPDQTRPPSLSDRARREDRPACNLRACTAQHKYVLQHVQVCRCRQVALVGCRSRNNSYASLSPVSHSTPITAVAATPRPVRVVQYTGTKYEAPSTDAPHAGC